MRFILLFTIALSFTFSGYSQFISQPESVIPIIPHKIKVTHRATTVLVFPYTVLNDPDRGIDGLVAAKVTGVENVLKLKAAFNYLDTTSLHVFTSDGGIHVFEVTYDPKLFNTTYKIISQDSMMTIKKLAKYQKKSDVNEKELDILVNKVRHQKGFLNDDTRKYRMQLLLRGIYFSDDIMFFKFNIKNKSNLPYQAGWARLYLMDKIVSKRTSVQQLAIDPLYRDDFPYLAGKSKQDWIIAIPKTTIPDKKQLIFELQEDNGGRHLKISIQNRDLFKSRKIL
ncbi:conjugative transposon protein TraN [Chitinophaga niabensis]|uniref:Bacteroides conjugative transposon TraN protein n=1 Tax=Chitinophaga niabensis TaxID=536979 RepID=A0A1N6KBB1_9BACT|nr:conjugative transposon protein TraN [Chitinophaga niabensis]SIO53845.1 Bacteroides conjugative transposon TraN protein [Chitinophaga niabensis]